MFWNNYPTNHCQLSNQKGKSPVTANMEYKTLSDCTHTGTLPTFIYFILLYHGICPTTKETVEWKHSSWWTERENKTITVVVDLLQCCKLVFVFSPFVQAFSKDCCLLTAVQWHTYVQAQTQAWTAKYIRILCRFTEDFPHTRWIILYKNVSSLARIK